MSHLALSASFEYLCYGSTAILNIFLLRCGDRQILTSKVDPRAKRVETGKLSCIVVGRGSEKQLQEIQII